MNIETLKARAKLIFGEHPLKDEEIQIVEKSLGVKFSKEFIELNKICSYEYSNFVSFFNFGVDGNPGDYGVVGSTLGLRQNFENIEQYVDLYNDDAGIILMNCSDQKCSVIWCSIYDLENLFNGKKLEFNNDYFPTFTDFFAYLLDEEEKSRSDDHKKS